MMITVKAGNLQIWSLQTKEENILLSLWIMMNLQKFLLILKYCYK